MTRLFSRIFIAFGLTVVAGVMLNGCVQAPAVEPTPQTFAALRVMNFIDPISSDPTNSFPPIDVFVDHVGADTLADINGLPYGQASVYLNNLPATASGTNYHILIRPVRDRTKILKELDVTLKAGEQSTLVVTHEVDGSGTVKVDVKTELIRDASGSDNAAKAWVRFVNLQPADQNRKVVLRVNDALRGDAISDGNGMSYGVWPGSYTPIGFATDTAYAFYATVNGEIVSRIAFESFAPGSYHTIILAGDSTRTAPFNPKGNPLDSLRLRVFDDNNLGNDQTNPVPLTFRYNIVNNLIKTPAAWIGTPYESDDFRSVGFIVNNDANHSRHDFTFNPVPIFGATGAYAEATPSGMYEVQYASSLLTEAINVKGYLTNQAATDRKLVFDVRVGRKVMSTDRPYSIVFFDTLPMKKVTTDSSALKGATIPMPENPSPDKATLVIIAGASRSKGNASTSVKSMVWYGMGDPSTPSGLNGTTGAVSGRYETVLVDPGNYKVKVKVGGTNETVRGDFNFEAGGIYEVVAAGYTDNPEVIVVHVNGTTH